MTETQLHIIRQSSLNRSTDLHSKTDDWTEDKIIKTAEIFANWVIGSEGQKVDNILPDLPPVDEDKKVWLNEGTSEFNQALDLVGKGYTVTNLRTQYKISKKIQQLLEKLQSQEKI